MLKSISQSGNQQIKGFRFYKQSVDMEMVYMLIRKHR